MKLLLLFTALCPGAVSTVRASILSLSDFSGFGATFVENRIKSSTGALLQTGLVRVGYFPGLGTDFSESLMREVVSTPFVNAFVASQFFELGTGLTGTGTRSATFGFITRVVNGVPQTGRLTGQITSVQPDPGLPANGYYNGNGVPVDSQMFLLIYDGMTVQTSTEVGIFSASTWRMPANPQLNLLMNTNAVDTMTEVYRGTLGSLVLAPMSIPEPGTAGLALAGAAMLLRRRRSVAVLS